MGTLFYIPEFLSSCSTERAGVFRALCDEFGWKFVPMDYPSYNPTLIYMTFSQIILQNLDDTNNIFIGTGLGGFWSNFFARDFLGKTVLINPCVNPSSTLYKFLPEDSDTVVDSSGVSYFFTEEMINKYAVYESLVRSHYGTILFLGKDDPMIDWRTTNILFKNDEDVCVRLYNDGGHTMDTHFGQIVLDTRKLMELPYFLLPQQAKQFREALVP